MSLKDWQANSWLVAHQTSAEELRNLLGIADRDLRNSKLAGLHADWKFAIAYNAALQVATAALAAAGFRSARDSHHYRIIESLEFTIAADVKLIRTFDAFRKKRNHANYEVGGSISDKEAEDMLQLASSLRAQVETWLMKAHPELLRNA